MLQHTQTAIQAVAHTMQVRLEREETSDSSAGDMSVQPRRRRDPDVDNHVLDTYSILDAVMREEAKEAADREFDTEW